MNQESRITNTSGRRDDADEEIEQYAVPFLQTRHERLRSHARHAHLAVRFVREPVMQVVRQLAVNADRLQPIQDRFA